MAPAAAGIPLTAGTPFATAGAPNGGVPSITQAAVAGGAGLHHAHNFAAAAAAAAAAQQQQQHQQQHQHQHQQQHQQNAVLGSPFTLATSLKPSTVSVPSTSVIISSNTGTGSSPVTTTTAAKTGSPAAKKFRPAFARPSHKSSRYIPKPIPQELGNLKTYSKPYFISTVWLFSFLFCIVVCERVRWLKTQLQFPSIWKFAVGGGGSSTAAVARVLYELKKEEGVGNVVECTFATRI